MCIDRIYLFKHLLYENFKDMLPDWLIAKFSTMFDVLKAGGIVTVYNKKQTLKKT